MASRAPIAVLLLVVTAGCVTFVPVDAGEPREPMNATVIEVVDGDTIDVRFADGRTDRVRLLGVDTPEVHVENTPDEYEGVPDTEAGRACLRSSGEESSDWMTETVEGDQVTLVFDSQSDARGGYDRLLAYVVENGTDINQQLLEKGYARVYDGQFDRSTAYYATEATAREDGVGLWHCSA